MAGSTVTEDSQHNLLMQNNLTQNTINAASSNTNKKRKLVLHFDQHNTIQVACTLPGRSLTVEEGLNNFLTAAVWGYEDEESEWQWLSEEPSINKPPGHSNAMSYFKYLEKRIVKCPDDRAELKKRTCEFVYSEPGSQFREFFDLYLESLIYEPHWSPQEIETQPDETATDGSNSVVANFIDRTKLPCNTIPAGDPENRSLYHLILPDFFDMMRRFQREKRQFTVILRTMGIESHNFLATIRSVFENKHKKFPDLQPMHVNPNIGQIHRSANDIIELHIDGEVYDTDEAIYEKLCSLEGVNAIRDDFAYWQKNNYECYAAKPLWINLLDKNHHHIIFDDNIRLDSVDDCIANLRLINSSVREYENVDFDYYNIFEKSSIIQPNLIHLLNPLQKSDSTKSYYYEKVKKAEKVYDLLLECESKLNIQTKSDLDSSNGLKPESPKIDPSDIKSLSSIKIGINTLVDLTLATNNTNSGETLSDNQSNKYGKEGTAITSEGLKKNERTSDLVHNKATLVKSTATSRRKAKIKLERCLSKEDEMILDKEDNTVSTICSIQ
jgi:hypothetical protein